MSTHPKQAVWKTKRSVGRPKGAIQTPETMLFMEMKEACALLRKTRRIITEQLDSAEEQMQTLPLADKLELIGKLAQITTALNKSLEQAAKYISTASSKVPAAQETSEDLMKEILGSAYTTTD